MDTTLSVDKIQRLIVEYEGGARTSIFVPNVSWGYFKSHEADLLRISKQGYLTEYEIKRSWSDFLADFKKDGTHFEGKVAPLYADGSPNLISLKSNPSPVLMTSPITSSAVLDT